MLRGRVASLNGPARYLAMAGEFFVDWPTMDSAPLWLKEGEIEDIAMAHDALFRGGYVLNQAVYFLLTTFTQAAGYSGLHEAIYIFFIDTGLFLRRAVGKRAPFLGAIYGGRIP